MVQWSPVSDPGLRRHENIGRPKGGVLGRGIGASGLVLGLRQ